MTVLSKQDREVPVYGTANLGLGIQSTILVLQLGQCKSTGNWDPAVMLD